MAAAFVFNVDFGFNETELTSLLEDAKFQEAEQLIIGNAHTSYLEEGCHQRTPLFIVLCGTNRAGQPSKRNFHIAKLLAQCGASPNFRVPETNMGLYMNPGKSPLELLIQFYINIITQGNCDTYETPSVIGLNNQYIMMDMEAVKDDIMELVFILLSHGGDFNIKNRSGQTLLHRVLLSNDDMRLVQFLCENGADLNAKDVTLITPLMYACSEGKYEKIKYLLTWETVQVNDKNRNGKTALFFSMKRGDWKSAEALLTAGSDPVIIGSNYSKNPADSGRAVSPLLVSFMSETVQINFRKTYLLNCQATSVPKNFLFNNPLLETGKFNKMEIVEELCNFVDKYMPNFIHMKRLGIELIHALFGTSTSTLKQMCARQLFINWVRNCWPKFNPKQNELQHLANDDAQGGVTLLSQHSTLTNEMQLISISVPDGYDNYCPEESLTRNIEKSVDMIRSLDSIKEDDEENSVEDVSDEDDKESHEGVLSNQLEEDNNNDDDEDNIEILLSPGRFNFIMLLSYAENLQVEDIEDLVLKSLHLPKDTIVNFEIELLRLVLLSYFGELLTPSDLDKMYAQCDGLNFDDSDDDNSLTEEDESDLEYW